MLVENSTAICYACKKYKEKKCDIFETIRPLLMGIQSIKEIGVYVNITSCKILKELKNESGKKNGLLSYVKNKIVTKART